MPDIHFERRRQRVAQQLGELTVLTPAWRRFLSVPLMRNGWHVLVERENSRSDRFDAYAVGPGGVFALSSPRWYRPPRNYAGSAGVRRRRSRMSPRAAPGTCRI